MTYRELFWLQKPEAVRPFYRGGCTNCPDTCRYESQEASECRTDYAGCKACCDREIPDKVIAVAVRGGKSLGGTHYRPGEEFEVTEVIRKPAEYQVRVIKQGRIGMYVPKGDFRYRIDGKREEGAIYCAIPMQEAVAVLEGLYGCNVMIIKE